jgi:hypothetical protein
MKWRGRRMSTNVIDRRGARGVGGTTGGFGTGGFRMPRIGYGGGGGAAAQDSAVWFWSG